MGNITKFLCFLMFLCLVTKGSTQFTPRCGSSTINIKQVPTGKKIQLKTELNVTITNTCSCTILSLNLLCPNFKSITALDPSIISKSNGGKCLINNGMPLYAGKSVGFTYAGDRVNFAIADYGEACS